MQRQTYLLTMSDLIYHKFKMIQHNSVNINLADSQVDKLKTATQNST